MAWLMQKTFGLVTSPSCRKLPAGLRSDRKKCAVWCVNASPVRIHMFLMDLNFFNLNYKIESMNAALWLSKDIE